MFTIKFAVFHIFRFQWFPKSEHWNWFKIRQITVIG